MKETIDVLSHAQLKTGKPHNLYIAPYLYQEPFKATFYVK